MRRELSLFFRQVGTAYGAGVPLTEGLRLATGGCREGPLKRAAADVLRRVGGGGLLGPALAAHPDVFSDLDTALVTVSEENGQLERGFFLVAERCEREHGQRQRLLLGLLYPGGLLVAALLLPPLYVWVTSSFWAYLLAVSRTAAPILAGLGLLAGAVTLFRRRAPQAFDRLLLELPVAGPNLRKLALARFCDSLAALYGAGVEIRRSVRLAIRTMGNRYLGARCGPVNETLERGGNLTEGLRAARVFPSELVQAVDVGERTGELDGTLQGLARLYQEEADRALAALLKLLPVVVYLLVALYIALIVISAFGAYFRLLDSI